MKKSATKYSKDKVLSLIQIPNPYQDWNPFVSGCHPSHVFSCHGFLHMNQIKQFSFDWDNFASKMM